MNITIKLRLLALPTAQVSTAIRKNMNTHRKIIIKKERQVNTYSHMWHTALVLHRTSGTAGNDSIHLNRASLIFLAFSMEAFLNHIGHLSSEPFDSFERLKIKEKVSVLSRSIGFKTNFGRRPWQILKPLFSYRNDIAHGKTTLPPIEIKKEFYLGPNDSFKKIEPKLHKIEMQTPWEKFCNEKNVDRVISDLRQIFEIISKAAGIEDDLFIGGYQASTVGPLNDIDL